MAAILNRNENELSPNEDIDEINWNIDTYALQVRPDLLRLYIARHKGKNKYHKSCYIKFGYATESVEIQTMYPWFEKMLDRYLYKFSWSRKCGGSRKRAATGIWAKSWRKT